MGDSFFNFGIRQIHGDIVFDMAFQLQEVKKLVQGPYACLFYMNGRGFIVGNEYGKMGIGGDWMFLNRLDLRNWLNSLSLKASVSIDLSLNPATLQ